MTPEERARQTIDEVRTRCGWKVQDKSQANLHAAKGVALRELSFKTGEPDYTLFVDGKAIATVEAKPEGHSLVGVEEQSTKYVTGIPAGLPAWRTPLPFSYESTGSETRFTEEYIVQHLTGNQLDTSARVVIGTIQRLYSMLQGEAEPAPDLDDLPIDAAAKLYKEPVPVAYNPAFPIEAFDFIVTDECHRSLYNLWRQVLEYFDAGLIGLTATPSKQTFGFFQQNLVMEYGHEQAVADGVNVGCDIYRIQTDITAHGGKVDAGYYVDKRDRQPRKVRWEQLDEVLAYDAGDLDREVVAPDQIRTVLTAFRDRLFTDMFPGRTDVPKILIFAKDDSHADDNRAYRQRLAAKPIAEKLRLLDAMRERALTMRHPSASAHTVREQPTKPS
jgi:type I site-specific restriction endonuclease